MSKIPQHIFYAHPHYTLTESDLEDAAAFLNELEIREQTSWNKHWIFPIITDCNEDVTWQYPERKDNTCDDYIFTTPEGNKSIEKEKQMTQEKSSTELLEKEKREKDE